MVPKQWFFYPVGPIVTKEHWNFAEDLVREAPHNMANPMSKICKFHAIPIFVFVDTRHVCIQHYSIVYIYIYISLKHNLQPSNHQPLGWRDCLPTDPLLSAPEDIAHAGHFMMPGQKNLVDVDKSYQPQHAEKCTQFKTSSSSKTKMVTDLDPRQKIDGQQIQHSNCLIVARLSILCLTHFGYKWQTDHAALCPNINQSLKRCPWFFTARLTTPRALSRCSRASGLGQDATKRIAAWNSRDLIHNFETTKKIIEALYHKQ